MFDSPELRLLTGASFRELAILLSARAMFCLLGVISFLPTSLFRRSVGEGFGACADWTLVNPARYCLYGRRLLDFREVTVQ